MWAHQVTTARRQIVIGTTAIINGNAMMKAAMT